MSYTRQLPDAFSESAKAKIEAAGGKAEVV